MATCAADSVSLPESGGGIIEALSKPFLKIGERVMREQAMEYNCAETKVLVASLGDDAVMFGAAKLIQEELERRNIR